ncbi:MAG: hypothetical protein HC905_19670 [Bacteroidales bacterium]|nr:hypothetical protein [Bacteroidales bacterium]
MIYFANSEGLIEYNGLTSHIYRMPFNKGARSVCIDSKGIIFTGGFEEIGFWQKKQGCEMMYTSLTTLVDLEKNDEIWKIYSQNGKMYFQSFTSIYVYDYKTIKKNKAPFTMLFMFPMEKGFFVQVLGNGLYTFEMISLISFRAAQSLPT